MSERVRMGKEELFAVLGRIERGKWISPEVLEFFVETVRYMEGQIDYQANYIQAYRDENEQQRVQIARMWQKMEKLTGQDSSVLKRLLETDP